LIFDRVGQRHVAAPTSGVRRTHVHARDAAFKIAAHGAD
jgi:hypothetical protein